MRAETLGLGGREARYYETETGDAQVGVGTHVGASAGVVAGVGA